MPPSIALPSRDPLQDSLQYLTSQSLAPVTKAAILTAVYSDSSPLFNPSLPSLNTYITYFESTCRDALQRWKKYDIWCLRIYHVTTIGKMVLDGKTRGEIEWFLEQEWGGYGEGEVLAGAEKDCMTISGEVIDLSARLALMVPIWSIWIGDGEGSLMWVDGTIKRSFGRHFKGLQMKEREAGEANESRGKKVELDADFTARNIEHVSKMKVIWTSNLLDHLLVRDEEFRTVRIFHHAGFLQYQQASDVYPEGLIDETLRTLSLLLPANDREVKDWSVAQVIRHHIDLGATQLSPLTEEDRNIENFEFWRDRLVHLKECYDSMMPRTTKIVKKLRRNLSKLNI